MKDFEKIVGLKFWCQKVLPLVYDDSLSYYELLCKLTAKVNETINTVNNIPDYLKELIKDEQLEPLLSTLLDELRLQISPINEHQTETATANRNKGAIIWINDKLYEATRDILAGDRYVIGGNIKKVDIVSLLADVRDDITDFIEHLDEEIQNRIEADNLLQVNIDTEEEARRSADELEKQARINADNVLREEIKNKIIPEHYVKAGVETRLYIDGISGDDNNDGTTREKAFKTIERFFEECNKGKSTDIRCYIISPGIYYYTKWILNGIVCHIEAIVNGVTLFSTSDEHGWVIYNSHVNLLCSAENGYMTITDNNVASTNSHWENSAITAQHIIFDKVWYYYGGYGHFNDCIFNSSLHLVGSSGDFTNCTFKGTTGRTCVELSRSAFYTFITNVTFDLDDETEYLLQGFGGDVSLRCPVTIANVHNTSYAVRWAGGVVNCQVNKSSWEDAGGFYIRDGVLNDGDSSSADNELRQQTIWFSPRNKNIVFIGDSWTVGHWATGNNGYSSKVATKLGMTKYQYATSGAGFLVSGKQFRSNIENAISSMSDEEKNDTGIVILVGGINDIRHPYGTLDDLKNEVKYCFTTLATNYPNARIIAGVGTTPLGGLTAEAYQKISAMKEGVMSIENYPIEILANMGNVLNGLYHAYSNQDSPRIHPNDLGHTLLASYICSCVLGGGSDISRVDTSLNYNTEVVSSNATPFLMRNNDIITLVTHTITLTESTSSTKIIGTMPDGYNLSPMDIYIPVYVSNRRAGALVIYGTGHGSASGNIYIAPDTGVTITNCVIGTYSWKFM